MTESRRCWFVRSGENTCRRGNNCPFIHEENDFRSECIYYNTTGCYKGKNCPFKHSYQFIPFNYASPIESQKYYNQKI
jgi:hypothetical protein